MAPHSQPLSGAQRVPETDALGHRFLEGCYAAADGCGRQFVFGQADVTRLTFVGVR